MDDHLVAGLPAGDALADLPDDAGGVGAADVMAPLRVVAVAPTPTGSPSAAHTLLKFTPAAITRTITSNAPGSGTSISSSWNASIGSPWRSSRMTQAAIVRGELARLGLDGCDLAQIDGHSACTFLDFRVDGPQDRTR